MFLRTGITSLRGFLDLTALFSSDKDASSAKPMTTNHRSISLWDEATYPQVNQEYVVAEKPQLDTGNAAEWARDRQTMLLEGFALEEVTEICMSNDYRWRCSAGHTTVPAFLISPVTTPAAKD